MNGMPVLLDVLFDSDNAFKIAVDKYFADWGSLYCFSWFQGH